MTDITYHTDMKRAKEIMNHPLEFRLVLNYHESLGSFPAQLHSNRWTHITTP